MLSYEQANAATGHWQKSNSALPLSAFPQEQTLLRPLATSEKCQEQSFQQTIRYPRTQRATVCVTNHPKEKDKEK